MEVKIVETLEANINRVISDFDSIKFAIESRNIEVGNAKTSEYADMIMQIKDEQDYFIGFLEDSATKVVIPEGTSKIRPRAFIQMANLNSVVIPEGVVTISEYAFSSCTNLEEVEFNTGLETIGNSAFHSCIKLIKIVLPVGIKSIGVSAFRGCKLVDRLIIPSGTTTIGSSAFYGLSALTHLEIPNTITQISSDSFYACSGITELVVEDGFNASNLNISYFSLLTADDIVTVFDALYDRTGKESYNLILGSTHLSKLTDEQKAIATDKNWILA